MRDNSLDLLLIYIDAHRVTGSSGNIPPNVITLDDGNTVVTTDGGDPIIPG